MRVRLVMPLNIPAEIDVMLLETKILKCVFQIYGC